jgi:putative membrane protein
MHLIIRFIINAIVLYLIAKFVPGFNHNVGAGTAIIAAIVFGIVNALIGPVLRLLTAPINWLTHGLFALVVNYILFWLTVWIAPNFKNTGVDWPAWLANLVGAAIMMVVATALQQAWAPRSEQTSATAP